MSNLDNFKFENKNGVMMLVGYKADEKIVVIPDEFEGMPITVIDKDVFPFKNLVPYQPNITLNLIVLIASGFISILLFEKLRNFKNFKYLTF